MMRMVKVSDENKEEFVGAIAKSMFDVMIEFRNMGFDLEQMINCDYFIDRVVKAMDEALKEVNEQLEAEDNENVC